MKQFNRALFLLVLFVLPSVVRSQELHKVEVRLSTETGRSEFRIGEPIRLKLSFTAVSGDFALEQMSSKPGSSHEQVVISPRDGVFDWSTQYMRGRPHMDCVVSRSKLSTSPTEIILVLNDFVRFDSAGTYAVAVRTKRVVPSGVETNVADRPEFLTNEIKLTITEMSEAEEEAETKRISAAIDSAKENWWEQTRLAERLSYLTGTPSTKEKVKRFLNPLQDVPGNYIGEIRWGLFIARDRGLVVKLLHEAFRDPSREVDFDLLSMLSMMKTLAEIPGDRPYSDEEHSRVERGYLSELADSLSGRKGIPRGAAAITILQKIPRENPPPDLLAKVRSILLADFDSYNMYSREYLLRTYWDQLKDRSLVPSIERMLTERNYPDSARINVETTAIERLIELNSERAKPFVAALIRDASSIVSDGALDGLDAESLPEVDQTLLEQITKLATPQGSGIDQVRLRAKLLQAARYASVGIYGQLLEIFRTRGKSWQADLKAIILGYFLKHNPPHGLEMIKEELKAVDEQMRGIFLHDTTRFAFPADMAELLELQLNSEDAVTVGNAAYILSKRGSEKHKEMVRDRLEKWAKRWAGRAAELERPDLTPESARQVRLQVELVSAMVTARAWKLSSNELLELKSSCVIKACSHYFPAGPNK